jgi:Kdo2-lipid IVA lauroyltransferase/acyltransferase
MNLRFQFERFGFWLARLLATLFSRGTLLKLASCFGDLAYRLDKRHRIVAIENFRAAFPDSTKNGAENVIRETYRFFARYLFDMLACFPVIPAERFQSFEVEGVEHLEAAYKRGKGVILFGGHFGAWELMALAHGARGWPLELVVRRLDNPYLESLLEKLRTSTGNAIIEKKQGFRPMLRALREGKGIAVLMDQNVSTEDRIFVEFFSRPASTTPAVALLKLKTDASLMAAYSFPLPGNRYRFVYSPPVEVPLTGNREDDVRLITQECTRTIEHFVTDHPECWLWMHRRWKTQPPQEPVLA